MRLIAFWPCWRASGAGPPNKRLLLSVTGWPYGGLALQRALKGTMLARSRTAKPLGRSQADKSVAA